MGGDVSSYRLFREENTLSESQSVGECRRRSACISEDLNVV